MRGPFFIGGLGVRIENVVHEPHPGFDESADSTAHLQARIDAAPAGGVLFVSIPTTRYLISAPLTINKALTLVSEGAEIYQSTENTQGIIVTADGVHIRGLKLTGPQYAAQQANSRAIDAQGASAADPIRSFRVEDCTLDQWGMYGLHMKHVNGFRVKGNNITNINYAGVMGLSVLNGRVSGNDIENIVGTPNAYGVAMTRASTDSLATDPRSTNVLVTRNSIKNVLNWEGLDTHGGQRIRFTNNDVVGCKIGIAAVSADNASQVSTWAPLDCTVSHNTIDSGKTDGTAGAGIQFAGASAVAGTSVQAGTGTVVGNVVRGHGPEDNNLSGAMYIRDTSGAIIANNVIIDPSPAGILLYYNNAGFVCANNFIIDAWTDSVATAIGINIRSTHNTGLVVGTSVVRGSKSATLVLSEAVRIFNDATNSVTLGPLRSEATLPFIDQANVSSDALRAKNIGFYNTTPIAKQTVLAAAIDAATTQALVNDLRAKLIALGLLQ